MLRTTTRYRVIYGDTDQMGMVYYANYLRWFEMGRTEFMRALRMPYAAVEREGFFFPVVEVHCHYQRPARFDDLIAIETTLENLTRITLQFGYHVYRETDRLTLALGWTKHACLNHNHRPVRVPKNFHEKLGGSLAEKE